MIKSILVVLGLALVGCTASNNPSVFRPEGFSAEQIASLREAADDWTAAGFPTMIDPACTDDGCSTVTSVPPTPAYNGECWAFDRILGVPRHVGCTQDSDPIRYEIRLRDDLDLGKLYRVMLHELGHTKGLPDSHVCGKTMYYDDDPACFPATLVL